MGEPAIRSDVTLRTIDQATIVRLPQKASEKLPSRGQVAVHGTINGHEFETVLEPDGSKELRRRYCNGGWWPTTAEVTLFNRTNAGTTRYRYRGTAIPSPWLTVTT